MDCFGVAVQVKIYLSSNNWDMLDILGQKYVGTWQSHACVGHGYKDGSTEFSIISVCAPKEFSSLELRSPSRTVLLCAKQSPWRHGFPKDLNNLLWIPLSTKCSPGVLTEHQYLFTLAEWAQSQKPVKCLLRNGMGRSCVHILLAESDFARLQNKFNKT